MDPSQIQEDKSNDVHSLENEDEKNSKAASVSAGADSASGEGDTTTATTDDGKTKVTDTTGGQADAPLPTKKESVVKKIWHKFNIYLMLFFLVVILAIGILVLMTVKTRQDVQKSINSQALSQSALQQLANTDVTVGDAKQILTVQSNAVFAGSVLIKSNFEIAGTLKVGGESTLSSLKVSGATQLNDTTASTLTVNGALSLQGALTLKSGLNVSGSSNFAGNLTATSIITGGLQLNGDLNLTHHITAGGTIPNASRGTAVGGGGTVSLSGSDTAGSIAVNTGSSPPAGCFVSVTFSQKFSTNPHVSVTPIGSAAAELTYYVDRSTTGFSICSTTAAPAGQSFGFDYVVLG